ncbi:hypothetical protein [Streptacidiphilus jiangxiensis]|uniref:hypothetical protein n=1 Tax=Streptacidiphilus jiangxiensis TaxID=235985 RepID=UPI00116099F1|nr:hypothetical protein [Streptacidiphilus jiangxiensis]
MPSLRNPVGPLPASIYWRRRLVVLAALGVVAVLVSVLAFGGGGGDRKANAGSTGTPASSLTPGPTGRGGSNDGATGGSGGSAAPSTGASGSGAPTAAPSGAPVVTGGSGSSGTGSSGTGSTGSGGSGSGGTGTGGALTPNQSGTLNLQTCAATDLDLSLTSTAQTYRPSQFPAFQLGITNTSGSACKVDLGSKSAVLSITSDTGAQVWSSGNCPKDTSAQWYAVPAAGDGPLTALFGWGRTTSKPGCTPGSGGGNAPAGTYVAHIGIGGVSAQPQHWFKLAPFGS